YLLLSAELTLPLRRLLREDVAHVGMAGFEPAITFRAETLCSAALRLQLRHDLSPSCLARSSVASCWAGGPAPTVEATCDAQTLVLIDGRISVCAERSP